MSKEEIISYFQPGDTPTADNFKALIDFAVDASSIEGQLENNQLPNNIAVTNLSGDGSGITNLTPANINGQLSNGQLPADINVISVSADGSGITNLTPANINGQLSDSQLPADINVISVSADGSNITNLTPANISGQLSSSQLPADINVTSVSAQNLTGDGSGITNLTAANINGQLSNSQLPSNITATEINADTLTFKSGNETNSITLTRATKSAAGVMRFANQTELDNQIDNLAVTPAQMSNSIEQATSSVMPLGTITLWTGRIIPAGWALCNGNTVNQVETPQLSGFGIQTENGVMVNYIIRVSVDFESATPEAPSIVFESTGLDDVYNAAELGQDGTIAATISVIGSEADDTLIYSVNEEETIVTLNDDHINTGLVIDVLPESIVTAQITDAAGNTSMLVSATAASADIVADIGTVTVNSITQDDVINAAENGQTITVTGTAIGGDIAQGDVVSMTISGTDYSSTVGLDGSWTVDVAGSDLVADMPFDVLVTSSDEAGNIVESIGVSTRTVNTVSS